MAKLNNVVVKSPNIAKDLLKSLPMRTVFIPLSAVKFRKLEENTRSYFENVAQGKAKPAIDLIEFD